MSSNLATTRLLARLAPIVPIPVADDVFVIAPSEVAAVRAALLDQPQIAYFLDRQMVADSKMLNDVGDIGWCIRLSTAAPMTRMVIEDMCETVTEHVTYGPTNAGGVNVNGYISSQQMYDLKTVSAIDKATGERKPTLFAYVGKSMTIERRRFGPIPIGPTVRIEWADDHTMGSQGQVDGALYEFTVGYGPMLWKDPLVTDSQVAASSSPSSRVPGAAYNAKVGMPVIAGPAVCEYAEFIPGFEWVSARYPDVAAKLDVVVEALGQVGKPADKASFVKARDDMAALTDAKLVLFRGSDLYDPLAMWPLASASQLTLDAIPVDGVVVTTESLAAARSNWSAGKWCTTSMSTAMGTNALADTITKDWAATVSIKPSGLSSFHLDNGLGTLELEMVSGLAVIEEARLAGKLVTVIESPFQTQTGFNRSAWNALVSAANDTTPVRIEGPSGYSSMLGEAICSRLITKAVFSEDEERLVLPAMSPQYFWTKFARKPIAL